MIRISIMQHNIIKIIKEPTISVKSNDNRNFVHTDKPYENVYLLI